MRPRRHTRPAIAATIAAIAAALAGRPARARAEEVPVPIRLQADVLFTVAGH